MSVPTKEKDRKRKNTQMFTKTTVKQNIASSAVDVDGYLLLKMQRISLEESLTSNIIL